MEEKNRIELKGDKFKRLQDFAKSCERTNLNNVALNNIFIDGDWLSISNQYMFHRVNLKKTISSPCNIPFNKFLEFRTDKKSIVSITWDDQTGELSDGVCTVQFKNDYDRTKFKLPLDKVIPEESEVTPKITFDPNLLKEIVKASGVKCVSIEMPKGLPGIMTTRQKTSSGELDSISGFTPMLEKK